MQQPSASSEVLAHWHYPPELWLDFVQYESSVRGKSVKSAKYFIAGTVLLTIVLVILFSVVPYLVTGKFGSDVWGPGFGILIVAEIPILIGVLMLKMRQRKLARFNTPTGEAIISINDLKINDIEFNWHYDKSGYGWRFLDAERKTVQVTPLKSIQVLELKFETFIPSKNTPQREVGEWRVPVQMGTESEADRVIERLRAQRVASEPN